jgi:hypothetical protein
VTTSPIAALDRLGLDISDARMRRRTASGVSTETASAADAAPGPRSPGAALGSLALPTDVRRTSRRNAPATRDMWASLIRRFILSTVALPS